MKNLMGDYLQGYEIRERIGVGGFGAVYRAYQTSVGRDVAVKVVLPHLASHPDFIRRFEVEAQVVARLEHPHIVPLHDYWRDPSGAYLIMRLLRGGNLRHAVQNQPYSVETAALLLDQITAALYTAHRNDIIHRDLKPENILLDEDGNAYLTDFGIARDTGRSSETVNQADAHVGSLDYLAPEQIRNEPLAPTTDIYALGIVLYEVLTGQHLFQGVSNVERIYRHLNDPLPPVTTLSPEIKAAVNAVIQKATAKNPAERYPDVLAVAAAFREAAGLARAVVETRPVEILTIREQEVLQLMMNGVSNQGIAQELYITLGTVKWYIKQIYRKLGVRNRVQAIVRARDMHLIAGSSDTATGAYATTGNLPEPRNPYKGLQAFEAADSHDFFGRETLIQQLQTLMAEARSGCAREGVTAAKRRYARFLGIVGPSGSGKSSLVKAGLIPALWRGDVLKSQNWFVVELVPGRHPLDELEVALARVAPNVVSNLRDQLQRDESGLVRVSQLILPEDNSELVLVIDQFEELFTLVEDEAARSHFLNSLVAAVTDPHSRIRIVMTLRADFYDRPLHYAAFGEMLRSRMVTLLPLTPEGLERAIVRPAERTGVTFEEGLVAEIIADVNYQPGALPLLQYALTELFERREGQMLTRKAYQSIGSAVGALAKQADDIYEGLDEAGKQAAQQLFLRLVTLGDDTVDTRRRSPVSELMGVAINKEVMDDLIDTYASYRLLSLDHDPLTHAPTVEIAHEALIQEWKRLKRWLSDNREDLRLRQRLMTAASEWDNAKRDPSFLAAGTRLTQFETLTTTSSLALSEIERAYLDAGILERQRQTSQRENQQRRLLRLQRGIIGVLLMALVVAAVLSMLISVSWHHARSQARIARARQFAAQAVAELQKPLGNDEFAALLAIRSLNNQYDPVADGALVQAVARLPLRAFVGHTDVVYAAAFSPDGQYVLTGSGDHTVRLWEAASGRQVRSFSGHDDALNAAVFSPDGQYVLTGSADQTARLWDLTTGEEVMTFAGHTGELYSVAFSPDGDWVLTSSEDATAKLWDVTTGELIRTFDDSVRAIAISPDGGWLVTSGEDYTVRIRDISTGRTIHTLRGHDNWVYAVAFSPDGAFLLTGSLDNTAILWDATTGQEMYTINAHSSAVRSVAFSPDGQHMLTGSSDRTLRLWDVTSGQEVRTFRGHLDRVWSVAFSPDGRYVLSGSADTTVKLWAVTPEVQTEAYRGHSDEIYDVAVSPDARYALSGSADHTARIWEVATGRTVHTLAGHSDTVYGVAFSPDGRYALTGSLDNTARLWDVATGQELRTFTGHEQAVRAVAFSPVGDVVLTGSADYTARLWDVTTGEVLHTLLGHNHEVQGVTLSPDGRFVLTGSSDNTAKLWDVVTGAERQTFIGHTDSVFGVAISPDGKHVLTGSADRSVKLWDRETGQQVRSFNGHTNTVYNVAFSPDGQYIVTGSSDRTARVWETATGELVRVLSGHESAVWGVAFALDGQSVLTGSLDHTARLWNIDYADFVDDVCARLLRDFTDEERKQARITDAEPTCPQFTASQSDS